MLLSLFGIGAIILAALITLPAAKKSGIGALVFFVVLALVGTVGAVIFSSHYHLPPSEKQKAEHTQHVITEWLEGQGAEVKNAPEPKDMLDGKAGMWNLELQGQELNLLCTPGKGFPEKAKLDCAETMPLISEDLKVDFDDIESGH